MIHYKKIHSVLDDHQFINKTFCAFYLYLTINKYYRKWQLTESVYNISSFPFYAYTIISYCPCFIVSHCCIFEDINCDIC